MPHKLPCPPSKRKERRSDPHPHAAALGCPIQALLGWETNEPPSAAEVCARVQHALAEQRRLVPGPLVRQPAPAAKLAAVLHMSAMDLWDVATEQDEYQMWEEARAIASRILAACPNS